MKTKVIDLFCGIGGLSYGFKDEGMKLVAGFDVDPSCKYAYEENIGAKFFAEDISSVSAGQILKLFGKKETGAFRILIGCAPCTPFSIYTGRYQKTKRARAKRNRNGQWRLLNEFSRLALAAKPDVISMENVPRLALHPIFARFVSKLETAGYAVTFEKVRADHHGVPQRRTRLVLIASRFGKVSLPKGAYEKRPLTVRDAIGNLPKIEAGCPSPSDRLHVTRRLTPKNLKRLKSTKEGGSWKDWDKSLQLACHKKRGGKSFRSVYGRMRWDAPAPVITTQCLGIGNGRFGHPEQDRAISIREAALLQSFPKKFKFLPPDERVQGLPLARQIGNAVPVKLGQAIAQAIKQHLADVSRKHSRA